MAYSLLATDGYKFSMAEVGWPLRRETFVYTHRKGGQQVLPIDVASHVKSLLPVPTTQDWAYLRANEYAMGEGYAHAIEKREKFLVNALPKGSTFFSGEPVFSVDGASALGSWLEPVVLQINFRIQVATMALRDPERLAREVAKVTCWRQKEIIAETLQEMKVKEPKIEVDTYGYQTQVLASVRKLIAIVKDPNRIFEVGMRSVTCMEQHQLALEACKEAGVKRTSNVFLAEKLGMIPVGTMGHEHLQRYGGDEEGFRAMKDRRPYRSSYLPDTYDFFLCGLPAALRVMMEDPERKDSIRYDSGNKETQFMYVVSEARQLSVRPRHIVEDGLDDIQTQSFEVLREQMKVSPDDMFYGYGGFIVAETAFGSLKRDEVQAVWKLSMTGNRPTMKFSSDPGKMSIPGRPVVWRRTSAHGPIGIIGQDGESVPEGYVMATNSDAPIQSFGTEKDPKVILSAQTLFLKEELIAGLSRMRARMGKVA